MSQKNYGKSFGAHVRSCRKARGYTQEKLAQTSGLSADTIRRLEHGSFSPSLETLRKLTKGFQISLSSFFEAFELGHLSTPRELSDLVMQLEPHERELFIRLIPLVREFIKGQVEHGEE